MRRRLEPRRSHARAGLGRYGPPPPHQHQNQHQHQHRKANRKAPPAFILDALGEPEALKYRKSKSITLRPDEIEKHNFANKWKATALAIPGRATALAASRFVCLL